MSQNSSCGKFFGLLFIVFPIIALVFGNDEAAMQTDQVAIVMTAMILIGVIIIVNSSRPGSDSPPIYSSDTIPSASQPSSGPRFCSYCGAQVSSIEAKYCNECGHKLS